MSIVTLVSGGLDSSLMAVLSHEEGLEQFPLFIDYEQLCKDREWSACLKVHFKFGLPIPKKMSLNGFGHLIPSGLTDSNMRINEDAFLPGRNMLFILSGCAYAYNKNACAVSIGLISEEYSIFPDQTKVFIEKAQELINLILSREIKIIAPLMEFSKKDVIKLAGEKGITGTYSCHSGTERPCGKCISCKEIENAK